MFLEFYDGLRILNIKYYTNEILNVNNSMYIKLFINIYTQFFSKALCTLHFVYNIKIHITHQSIFVILFVKAAFSNAKTIVMNKK